MPALRLGMPPNERRAGATGGLSASVPNTRAGKLPVAPILAPLPSGRGSDRRMNPAARDPAAGLYGCPCFSVPFASMDSIRLIALT